MATKNIPLTIKVPGQNGLGAAITFSSAEAENDYFRIPRRYPFIDIANYTALKASNYFRHATTDVSTALGGSKVTNTEGKLGFALPNTEKLILLVKRVCDASGDVAEQEFTIIGSDTYGIDDLVVTLAAETEYGANETVIHEIDLYNFGLFIDGNVTEDGLMIKVKDEELGFALIARMG